MRCGAFGRRTSGTCGLREVLSRVEGRDDERIFWCPGCGCAHYVDARWRLSGTDDAPTVRPSVLVGARDGGTRCHLFVTDGRIHYLADCAHALAGRTVEMVPLGDV